MTRADAEVLGIKLQPEKSIKDKITDIVVTEVRGKLERKSKFWAEKTKIDLIDFDSKKEWARYMDLKLLEKAWEISDLKLQPKFLLQEPFKYNWYTEKRISYIADFAYTQNNEKIVEDVKGFKTDIYKMKRKVFHEKRT